jgi:hypothetical protein
LDLATIYLQAYREFDRIRLDKKREIGSNKEELLSPQREGMANNEKAYSVALNNAENQTR